MIPHTIDKKLPLKVEKETRQEALPKEKFRSCYNAVQAKKKPLEEMGAAPMPSPLELIQSEISRASTPPAVDTLEAVEALFAHMVEKMTYLHETGKTETTFFLQAPEGSKLSNTEITIIEYNTAPKTFNIEIKTDPAAHHLLDAHLGGLMTAFHAEERAFKIHRLEIHQNSKRATMILNSAKSKEEELTRNEQGPLPLG